jgi:hypothetical protein
MMQIESIQRYRWPSSLVTLTAFWKVIGSLAKSMLRLCSSMFDVEVQKCGGAPKGEIVQCTSLCRHFGFRTT